MISHLALLLMLGLQDPTAVPDLSQQISFTCGPTRVERLLPALSKLIKAPLLASGVTQDEVLVIRVTDVTADDLLKKIAQVSSAEWTPEGGGFRLIRPTALDQKEAAEEAYRREEAYRKSFEEGPKILASRPPLTDVAAKQLAARFTKFATTGWPEDNNPQPWLKEARTLSDLTPMQRTLARAVTLISPKQVCSLPAGRWVYSSRPTKMQLPLPPQADSILYELVREQNMMSPLMPKPIREKGAGDEDEMEDDGYVMPFMLFTPIPRGSKLLLLVSVRSLRTPPSLEVMVVGPDGRQIDSSHRIEGLGDVSFGAVEEAHSSTNTVKGETPLPIPPSLKAIESIYKEIDSGLGPEVIGELLRPSEMDPMNFGITAYLPAYAEAKDRDLVARIPDYLWGMTEGGTVTDISPTPFKATLEESETIAWTDEGGWTTIKPLWPHLGRIEQTDRKLLQRAVQLFAKSRTLNLEEMAQFASLVDEEWWPVSFWVIYSYMLDRDAAMLLGVPNQHSLKLYGGLNQWQKEAYWSEAGLPIADLTPTQRSLAEYIAFRLIDNDNEGAPSTLAMPDFSTPAALADMEITEAFPYGLAGNARLKGNLKRTPGYLGRSSEAKVGFLPASPRQLAGRILRNERDPERSQLYDKFIAAVNYTGDLRIEADGKALAQHAFRYSELAKNPQVLRYEDLPEAFRTEVQKELVMQRERQKNTPPPGNYKPPPAPG